MIPGSLETGDPLDAKAAFLALLRWIMPCLLLWAGYQCVKWGLTATIGWPLL